MAKCVPADEPRLWLHWQPCTCKSSQALFGDGKAGSLVDSMITGRPSHSQQLLQLRREEERCFVGLCISDTHTHLCRQKGCARVAVGTDSDWLVQLGAVLQPELFVSPCHEGAMHMICPSRALIPCKRKLVYYCTISLLRDFSILIRYYGKHKSTDIQCGNATVFYTRDRGRVKNSQQAPAR